MWCRTWARAATWSTWWRFSPKLRCGLARPPCVCSDNCSFHAFAVQGQVCGPTQVQGMLLVRLLLAFRSGWRHGQPQNMWLLGHFCSCCYIFVSLFFFPASISSSAHSFSFLLLPFLLLSILSPLFLSLSCRRTKLRT